MKNNGDEVWRMGSYIEQLLAALLLASVVVGGIMFGIGWFIAYLIEHKGDIK